MIIALYKTRRRTTSSREKVRDVILGIGSKLDNRHHLLFIDIDRKVDIYKLFSQLLKTIVTMIGHIPDYVVAETKKGYHIIVMYPFTWKQINTIWSKYKQYMDKKWITLQRKRGFAILRVSPKYDKGDIKILFLKLTKKWCIQLFRIYYAMLKGAHSYDEDIQGQRLRLREDKQKTLFNAESSSRGSESNNRARNTNTTTSRMGNRRVHEETYKRPKMASRAILLENNGYKDDNMEDAETNKTIRGAITTTRIRGGSDKLQNNERTNIRVEENITRIHGKG